MEKKFDLVIVGTGAAGATAAFKCRDAGWKVAIVDSKPFGGTCALRGCDPNKVLIGLRFCSTGFAEWKETEFRRRMPKSRIKAEVLKKVIYAYPTSASDISHMI
jgi:flavin-dependent dehydrogenase